MLRKSATLICDRCEAAVAGFERGWRAYVRGGAKGEESGVEVVCPACAERLFGEDELEARSSGET